jgi:hypothetical protein
MPDENRLATLAATAVSSVCYARRGSYARGTSLADREPELRRGRPTASDSPRPGQIVAIMREGFSLTATSPGEASYSGASLIKMHSQSDS